MSVAAISWGILLVGCLILMVVKLTLFIRINRRWVEKKNYYIDTCMELDARKEILRVAHHAFDLVDVFHISQWTEKDYVADDKLWKRVNSHWNNNH